MATLNQLPNSMNTTYLFISEIIISLMLSALILSVLAKPLVNAMTELCGSKQQAEFWLAYTRIMLLFYPLLLVLMASVFNGSGSVIESIKVSLVAALIGLLLGLAVVGKRLFMALKDQPLVKKDDPMFDH